MADMTASLGNWRQAPHSAWSFGHVDALIPVDRVAAASPAALPSGRALAADQITVPFEGRAWRLAEALAATATDSLMVLKHGAVVHARYRQGDASTRHILFSVSKSVTGLLAGVLVSEGKLDPDAPVTLYVPEVAQCAYGTATVRQVLDMTVDVTFVEDYLDTQGAFARYRAAMGWNPPNPAFGDLGLHGFLASLPRGSGTHGQTFHYVSPNSDLLGWIVERAAGESFASVMASRLWGPMGAEAEAYVTVDQQGAARAAGGICMTLADMARLGELVRCDGVFNGRSVVPAAWIADMWRNGDAAAWQRGAMLDLFPQARYRSQWYVRDGAASAMYAIGIHGQWIGIFPSAGVVIAKHSSQAEPVDLRTDKLTMAAFDALVNATL